MIMIGELGRLGELLRIYRILMGGEGGPWCIDLEGERERGGVMVWGREGEKCRIRISSVTYEL